MQDVRSTVLETLDRSGYGSYTQYAEPVITALVNRERDICGVLIEYATREGMDRNAIERALAHTGMAVPSGPTPVQQASAPVQQTQQQPWQQPQQQSQSYAAQPPTQQPQQNQQQGEESSVQQMLGQIQNTLSGLVAFARNHGFNG
jgi:hypothetical protein